MSLLCAVSQWEVPPEYQQVYASTEATVHSTTASSSATEEQKLTEATVVVAASQDCEASTEQTSSKRSVDEADVESRESHQPSKRRPGGAYGAWSTVAVYEAREDETTNEEGGEREEQKEESSSDEESRDKEDRLKFEEKTVSSLGGRREEPSAIVGGAFKGFGFKKRAGNRPQIRQLKTNDL